LSKLPEHVAIVMDGNGRWATSRRLPRVAGHKAGANAVKKAITYSAEKGIKVLTLFALSVENLMRRPETEIKFLKMLFLESLQRNTQELHDNNVRIRIVGDYKNFSKKLQRQIHDSQQLTANNDGLTLVIAMNYSGRWDIVNAVQNLIQDHDGRINNDVITEKKLQQYLCLADLPPPDLLIRTSGEQRISNFMIWQLAYTELFFTPVYWPDFDACIYEQALEFYQNRQRRFGGISHQPEEQYA
jgi:undecaprenyl diphosphate synthase